MISTMTCLGDQPRDAIPTPARVSTEEEAKGTLRAKTKQITDVLASKH